MNYEPGQIAAFRTIRVEGEPRQRGESYGRAAAPEIRESIRRYSRVFRHMADWDWQQVRDFALRYERPIGDFSPAIGQELAGIAAGAGVELGDILALNARSEIMFAAAPGRARSMPAECTSFALMPERTGQGIVTGQNWDWLTHARRTTIVLDVRRTDAPSFVTVVEAGQLAKVGLNAAGVALCTNTLIGDIRTDGVGIPYHILLRSVLDAESGADSAEQIATADRAMSANYLISDRNGFCQDLETTARNGAPERLTPSDGVLTHTNHFLSDGLTTTDGYVTKKPHTVDRHRNIELRLRDHRVRTVEEIKDALSDHQDWPGSICQHPDPSLAPEERTCTIAGVIIQLDRGVIQYGAGNPCTTRWRQHTVSAA
ncbi:C45 family autoproteolytic acyltransferase/hydrolase [Sphaerisporangium viridialbum]|uniref:C45 family autoproteolytic acyltransferase/hydolase n=1 Tax=Sphaerisporangium viridialbum TaxID=46189 RepID=UPI003C75C9A6